MEQQDTQQHLSPSLKQEKSEQIIEYRTKKTWSEWERILSMTDITSANQKEYIEDLRTSFNLEGYIASLIVIHYKSKHRLFSQQPKTESHQSESSTPSPTREELP
jgi:hypothetical protein